MAQYSPPPAAPGAGAFTAGASASGASEIKDKTISYDAANSEEILNISTASNTDVATTKEAIPRRVEIQNVGGVPLMIMAGYETYSDDTSDGVTEYLHTMIMPGETFSPPVRAIIRTGESSAIMAGTVVDNAAPDSNEYTDSTANVDSATASGVVGSNSSTVLYLEPYTSAANCSANLFRVNDLIRVDDEIMKVTAIGDKSDLANNKLTVERTMYGSALSTAAADGDAVRLPFFNAYHDFDKYSVAQTDSSGRFKCFNFFGQGRSATESQGIIPGSVAIKFYQPGYQELGLSGITSSTNSGLTASTAYKIDITVDGGTLFQDLTFTTDTSNLNFGGTNGIISKIQSALDTQYYTAGNLFEKKVTVGIVNGDIRFTSGQSLSTSAILLADTGDSGSFIDAAANGRIPASGDIPSAIAAKLPDDVSYDRITYATIPNSGAFGYDNGNGRLTGMCTGTINYETGAVDMTGCPVNAEFVVTCLHSSAFSGKLNDATTDRINSLVNVLANTTSQKWSGKVQTRIY